MYKVLLIGSTGKIGKYVLNALLRDQEFDVRILLRKNTSNQISPASSFQGDINEHESLYPGIEWCDVVVNCAGVVSYKPQDRLILHQTNVDGTKNILEACTAFKKSLLHTSSAVVYGSSNEPVPHTELCNYSTGYLSRYALSKLTADQLILQSPITSMILRPSTLISSYGSTFAKLLALYRKGGRAGLKGGASFVDPNDISKVYGPAILYLLKKDIKKNIFNLGGNNIPIREVFELFLKNEPRKTCYISSNVLNGLSFINDRFLFPVFNRSFITRENYLTGSLFTYLNSDKAKQELGYSITPFLEAAKNILNYNESR
ncbi:NAD-dependent epimerase/dehydratase family protein [Sphingobacterium shayense]|uniref:NAD-dependent epimerase/dehydratase family protein n=1 Tax=Sphingobacterium shayense TaxID=626343 RepID=UPI001551DCCC|nr:NAD-dependent epimerase/dehydratase family protein [Sphingobacterium shayense]NQD69828.1 NAD-dependent epimerase/dehydratase family protein [Sphingobacterium shayense]